MISQYVKDLSFENPNSPAVYQWQNQPNIDVQFNIGSSQLADDVYEVVLKIDVKADADGQVAFPGRAVPMRACSASATCPPSRSHRSCWPKPRAFCFPFRASCIERTACADGGFPPLMLEPIDFAQLYMQQQAQGEALVQAQPAGEA